MSVAVSVANTYSYWYCHNDIFISIFFFI